MPEGDTLHRIAKAIAPRLVGARVDRVVMERVERPRLRERTVKSVEAIGKHLLIGLGDLYLRTHLGLHGSWHRYPTGASWKRPAWQASLVLETTDETYVCFNAKEVDCIKSSRVALHRPLTRLGQDLLGERVEFATVVERARELGPEKELHAVLLDQRVASGIGNVYKNEVLFLTGHAPDDRLSELEDSDVERLFREARRQLLANVDRAQRTTTAGASASGNKPRLWVYRRAGKPCLRCGAEIRYRRMGRGRSTYWCPGCQPSVRALARRAR